MILDFTVIKIIAYIISQPLFLVGSPQHLSQAELNRGHVSYSLLHPDLSHGSDWLKGIVHLGVGFFGRIIKTFLGKFYVTFNYVVNILSGKTELRKLASSVVS